MIRLNLIGKGKRKKLPTVLGVDLNNLNFKLIIFAYILSLFAEGYVEGMIDGQKEKINAELEELNQESDQLKEEMKKYSNTREELEGYNEQVEKLRERSKQVTAIISQKTNPQPVLEQLAKLLPNDAWIETLEITKNSLIKITGGSESYVSVGNFIMSANQTTYFNNLNLISTETKEEKFGASSVRTESFVIEGEVENKGAWVQ